jgi:translation initiation factor 1 (eIF-1/SUI1)
VKRTAADNIPVYTIKRFNKNLIFTQVRKIRGDAKVIKDELTRICGTPARIIADGVIELNGNHRSVIKQWLTSNGF